MSIKAQYNILDEDIYNMDENRHILGIVESSQVVFSECKKPAYINQFGN